ncbi:acyl-CoA thioesterase [Bacillus coahuilensis]|uniref:acyl-CoA thioesterase n=1 Tax=Bacillus coahuilensis TaxID=408580 RepID=UPI0001850FE8|nr:thioesterase family protein [Bacillus coahuilensis]
MYIAERTIEVRYAETDQMGVVYHANYIVWLELGRTKLIETIGFRYADMEKVGFVSPVVDLSISYKRPITYGQVALIKTWVEEYNGVRVVYGYDIYNDVGELSVKAYSTHICAKKEGFKPVKMAKYFPEWDEAYKRFLK